MPFNINKDLNFGLFSVSKKIGPVSIVLDKLFRKEGPTQEEAEALAAANDAARKKRINDTGNIPGWPFRNHAQERRRTRAIDKVMVIPRMKFTFLVEFKIDQDWINSGLMVTNLKERELIRDGSIYLPIKSIDHPQVNFEVETLRSANRYVKVPKRMEYQPATVTFDDDVTSMIAALRKEYIHFYHYAGDVGQKIGTNDTANLDVETAWDEFQYETTGLVAPLGEQNRSRMDVHPSIGLKMRSDCSKHFFKEIVIYDLGVHPDSINAYYFYHPVVTSWTHDNLDYEDRSSKVTISMQYEYESYYDVIGQNNSKVEGILFQMFGIVPTPVPPSDDHATMVDPIIAKDQSLSVCAAQAPEGSSEPSTPPEVNCNPSGMTKKELVEAGQRITNRYTASTGRITTEDQARLDEINAELASFDDCEKANTPCPPAETADAASRTAAATGATPTDPAAAAGADTTKCRQNVGTNLTREDKIASISNEAAALQRRNDVGRMQRLSNQSNEASQEVQTATSDLEILETMKQSGGTEGSQELSREAYEDLTASGNIDDAIESAKERQEAAQSNLDTINAEIEPLGRRLNQPLPPPEPDPEVVRAETQQRLQGRRIEVIGDTIDAKLDYNVAKRDQFILDEIEAGNTSNKKFLSAPILNDLDERGLDSARETSDQQLANSEALLKSGTDELAELDQKIKAV